MIFSHNARDILVCACHVVLRRMLFLLLRILHIATCTDNIMKMERATTCTNRIPVLADIIRVAVFTRSRHPLDKFPAKLEHRIFVSVRFGPNLGRLSESGVPTHVP